GAVTTGRDTRYPSSSTHCCNSGCSAGSSSVDQKAAIVRGSGLPVSRRRVRVVASQVYRRPRINKAPRLRSTGSCDALRCFRRARSGVALLCKLSVMSELWGQFKMLSNRQRYQKMRGMSGTRRPARLRLGACTLLALALIGCSGTENVAARSDAQAAANGRQVSATLDTPDAVQIASLEGGPALRDQVGKEANTVTLIPPPEARQAVIDARDAKQKKQWD